METAIIWVAIAFVALCLWLVARNDLVRLNGISRQVRGEVIGHHSSIHDNARSYAPIYRFSAEGETHEVTDQVYSGAPKPPVGTLVQLSYPHGRPDLARVPRPWMWLGVYAVMLLMLGILVSRKLGWLPPQ